jgi:hypothetical protein
LISPLVFTLWHDKLVLNNLHTSVGYPTIAVVHMCFYLKSYGILFTYGFGIVYEYIKTVTAFAGGLVAGYH